VELLTRIKNLLALSRNKQDANPLTGLPGNSAIEDEVTRRLESDEDFCFLYLDLDNFKGYNDTYGYAKGDEAIKLLAGVMAEAGQKQSSGTVFTGHVGGDDFVMVTPLESGEEIADEIVREFDERKKVLFRADDLQRGYLSILDRQGVERRVSLIGLTVALVSKVGDNYSHMGELSDSAFELKKYGKQVSDSIVVKERRNLPEDAGGEGDSDETGLGSGTDGP
jgi:diguanylate cyclase (GGDEF)-like protein